MGPNGWVKVAGLPRGRGPLGECREGSQVLGCSLMTSSAPIWGDNPGSLPPPIILCGPFFGSLPHWGGSLPHSKWGLCLPSPRRSRDPRRP